MYFINGFIFDSIRQLVYNENTSKEDIEKINMYYDSFNKGSDPYDLQLDADAMRMDKIAINSAGICLSYNCNIRCRYCGYSSAENSPYRLQFEDVIAFIKDIVMRRTILKLLSHNDEPLAISFTGGGEPTYEWGLFEVSVQFIRQLCDENNIPLHLTLTTNGVLRDDQVDFISENFDHVMISYDGTTDVQNRNRVGPYLEKTSIPVERAIRRFSENGVSLNVRSTIWQRDFDKLIEMYRYIFSLVKESSPVSWSIYPVLFEGRAVVQVKKQNDIIYADFFHKYLELIDYIMRNQGIVQLKMIDVPLFDNRKCEIFCGAHKIRQPWLLPDKSIVTCIESKECKTIIGKISDGVVKYFESYQDPLLKITQRKYNECQECIAYSTCKGGCPIWHCRVDNDIQEPLECGLQKEYWRYVIEALVTDKYSLGWKLEKFDVPEAHDCKVFKVVQGESN